MKPSRPYLVRALHEWLLDNDCTPHIAVDATIAGVIVPEQFVTDGQIILNISPSAVQNLLMDNDAISFNARFGGVPMNVYVPAASIMAVYARENGMGMGFGMEPGVELYEQEEAPLEEVQKAEEKPAVTKPTLKVIK